MWTSFALIFLGLWQWAAPYTFGYVDHTHLFTGALLIIGGFYLRRRQTLGIAWAIAFVGLWLQLAPLIFWAKAPAAYLNDTLIGFLVILCSIILPSHAEKEASALPPGWSYNPSTWPSRILIAFFACAGWFISRYLAVYQLGYIDTMWDPFFGNGTVNVITSDVSRAFPISDAGLGAASYTIELLLACYGGPMRWRRTPWLVIIYGILVVPVSLVSIGLIILQPVAVGSWCTLCLMTAVCMLLMATLAVGELALVLQMFAKARRQKMALLPLFWKGFNVELKKDNRSTSAWTGITPTWRLLASAALGAVLMFGDALKDLDPVLGAFTIVISVIAMAEPIRSWRYANAAWGCLLMLALIWFYPTLPLFTLLAHAGVGVLLVILNLTPGRLRESCHFNGRLLE